MTEKQISEPTARDLLVAAFRLRFATRPDFNPEEEVDALLGIIDIGTFEIVPKSKRLETPVADGEVEEAAVYVESWSTIQRSACLNDVADKSLSIASLLRRQARENANLAEGWHDAEVKLVEVEAKLSAALSLNSVETREMNP